MPGSAHDFLYGHTIADESTNNGIYFFTSQIFLILQALGGSQKLRIYGCCSDCHADLPHRLANGVKKGVASVFHEMPAVGDLFGVWQGLCSGLRIPAAAISCHDFDLRLLYQPCVGSRRFSVGQQGDRLAPLKVADDRAISVIATPRPVINADDAWRRGQWAIISGNGSKQRVIANREPETICKTCCWPTTQCQSQMVHQGVQACCPAGHGSDHAITETLGKNVSAAIDGTTDEASDS